MINIEQIHDRPKFITNDSVNFLTLVGSHAYGGAMPESDYDYYGFVTPPIAEVFPHTRGEINGFGRNKNKFEQWEIQHRKIDDKETDITIYNITKYFQLVMDCNPNMVHSLFVPDNCIIHMDKIGQMVRNNRHLFLSEKAFHTFRGMAFSHLNRIKNRKRKPEGNRAELAEKYGYDTKDASYCLRLIWELEEVLFEGDLHIDRFGDEIIAVRNGKYKLHEVIDIFEKKSAEIEFRRRNSVIPYFPDENKIKDLLVDCLEEKYGSLSKIGYGIFQ